MSLLFPLMQYEWELFFQCYNQRILKFPHSHPTPAHKKSNYDARILVYKKHFKFESSIINKLINICMKYILDEDKTSRQRKYLKTNISHF